MNPEDWTFTISLAALALASASVSGSETAFFSLEPGQRDAFRSGTPLQRRVAALSERADDLLLTILILNNLINIAYFALASAWAGRHGEETNLQVVIGIGALVCLILFGEIFPKVLASSRPATMATVAAIPMQVAMVLCRPANLAIKRLLGSLLSRPDSDQGEDRVSAEELKLVIEQSHDHGVVSAHAHDRLMEVIDLSETTVASVMTHRVDCCLVAQQASREEAIEELRQKPSPFLLLVDDDDECIGMLAAQDLLKGGKPSKRARKPLYIPGNADCAQALELFRGTKRTAAVVVDEYGGFLGLITLAHLGNELLGPGSNVDLPEQPEPQQVDHNHWLVPGSLPLDGWRLLLRDEDTGGCTTIGGFVTKMLGAVPAVGDRVLYGNLLFQVRELDGRRIGTISVEQLPPHLARRMSRGPGAG